MVEGAVAKRGNRQIFVQPYNASASEPPPDFIKYDLPGVPSFVLCKKMADEDGDILAELEKESKEFDKVRFPNPYSVYNVD